MGIARNVLVHSRTRTVHELRENGTARCGIDLRPGTFERMNATEVEASAHFCVLCAARSPEPLHSVEARLPPFAMP